MYCAQPCGLSRADRLMRLSKEAAGCAGTSSFSPELWPAVAMRFTLLLIFPSYLPTLLSTLASMTGRRARPRALAASHTMTAAGIRNSSQRAPPYSASTPKNTSSAVKNRDSFEVALMTAPFAYRELLTVELSLVALEADARDSQANQSEGEQHLPVRCDWLVASGADNPQRQLRQVIGREHQRDLLHQLGQKHVRHP